MPRASWSPENLGDQLNELAASLGLRAHVHRRTPRRWVYGDPGRPGPCVPREPWPLLVCQLLHERLGEPVSLAALGWGTVGALQYVPADDGLDQSCDPAGQWPRWPRIGSGAVDQACVTASEAASVIRRLDSARDQRLLAGSRRAAAPYATSTAMRKFDAKYRDLVSAALT